MTGPSIFTRDELIGILAGLYLAQVDRGALRVFAASLCIRWSEVLEATGEELVTVKAFAVDG